MRVARIISQGGGYYHCLSRVIERRMIIDSSFKRQLHTLMRKVSTFSGVEILTHAIMTNHFHLLLRVPERPPEITDQELVQRLSALYTPPQVMEIRSALAAFRVHAEDEQAERLKARYTRRMYDLSEFMKTFKQRISQDYNRRNHRNGPLWESRFKSILVEPAFSEHSNPIIFEALAAVAAYIDLNPVRAGIVSDPKDYRYCGYGQAIAGAIPEARQGLMRVLLGPGAHDGNWSDVASRYRAMIYHVGQARKAGPSTGPARPGFSEEQVDKVLREGGHLSWPTLLSCRVRYFTDGLAIGSRTFIEDVFHTHHVQFGLKRTTGARPIKHLQHPLFTLRDLRRNPISAPT